MGNAARGALRRTMPKWYWKMFDALVLCGLATLALFVGGALAVGMVKETKHHPRHHFARPIGRINPAVRSLRTGQPPPFG